MLLENKVAVIYGAGGSIGGAIARAFAREGAQVFLSGRAQAKLEVVAQDIRASGGRAEAAVVDALDEAAVNAFADTVAAQAGRIDISCNVIGVGDVQRPLMDLSVDEFVQPIVNLMRTQFITGRAAARHMLEHGGGVIVQFGGGGPQTVAGIGGFKIALDALEGLRRQWSIELGKQGVRVVTITTGGIPESIAEDDPIRREVEQATAEATQLGRAATLADVGNVAAFVASDLARTLTSTDVIISCGAIVD